MQAYNWLKRTDTNTWKHVARVSKLGGDNATPALSVQLRFAQRQPYHWLKESLLSDFAPFNEFGDELVVGTPLQRRPLHRKLLLR